MRARIQRDLVQSDHQFLGSLLDCPRTARYAWILLAVLSVCFKHVGNLNGQALTTTASVNGTVQDPTGAVIPGAMVTLTNTKTSVKRTTVTGETGTYVLVGIPPGQYTLDVTKEGFKTTTQKSFELFVNQTATFDISLTVGELSERLEVTTAGVQIESSTAQLGTVIKRTFVNDLPLNGRQFTQLLRLAPGASPANSSQNRGGGQVNPLSPAVYPAMNGQPNRSNDFTLDGVPASEAVFSTFSVAPSVDSIQEFKVQSHNDEAQSGGAIGGFVNIATKTGTNSFHGTLWEFLRNNRLNARNPLQAAVPLLIQNQFGANLGGPVRLPRYNGRDKTFFFFSYEGFRRVTRPALAGLAIAPTPAQLAGDLSSLSTQIYNPFTTRPDPSNPAQMIRDPFPGNIIPSNLIDPNMVKFAQLVFPKPGPPVLGQFNTVHSSKNRAVQDQYTARIDHTFNPSNSLWFRYTRVPYTSSVPAGFDGLITLRDTPAENWGINYLHTFNPTTLLNVLYGHNGINNSSGGRFPALDPDNVVQATNFSKDFTCGFRDPVCQIPNVNILGFIAGGQSIGNNTPMTSVNQAKVDFTKIRGNHAFRAGGSFATNGFLGRGQVSGVTFDSAQTALPGRPGTGSPLASFLLGVPISASRQATNNWIKFQTTSGAYFQDQWKVTPNLTLNLGIRWDVSTWPRLGLSSDLTDAIGNLDLNTGTYVLQRAVGSCEELKKAPCIPGGLQSHPNVRVSSDGHLWRTSKDNYQPRVGLAYRLNDRTALRAGFSIFFDGSAGMIQQIQGIGGGWPSAGGVKSVNNLNAQSAGVPTVKATDPLAGQSSNLPAANPFGIATRYRDPLAKNPYSEQWNFGVQRELTSNTMVEANYVGSHSSRLTVGLFTNVAVNPGPGPIAPRRPFPYIVSNYFDKSIGRSSYNAFQFKLERRTSQGLTFLLSYTWSKAINIGSDGFFGVEGNSIPNPYDLNSSRGVTGFDLTHVLSYGWTYKIPQVNVGSSKFLSAVVNDWQVSGIFSAHSGQPYTLVVSGDIANTGNTDQHVRLDLVGDHKLSNPTPDSWFNRAAFKVPAQYTFGSLGRHALRADGYANLDLSLVKAFPIRESKRLEFRTEVFNFTNTPTWGLPVNNFNNPAFGRVTSTLSVERQVQFALKFYF